jgi:hypothetical protein
MHDDVDHAWFIFNLHTKILSLYLHTHNQLFGPNPIVTMIKEIPTYLEGQCFTLVPCLVATAHPLLSNSPSSLTTPSAHIMLQ